MEVIKTIGSYAGAIVTTIGLVVMIFKPIREKFATYISNTTNHKETQEQLKKILDSVEKMSQQNAVQSEALVAVIRNTLMEIYYNYKHADSISAYQSENVDKLFKAYKALGGNSFVARCVDEINQIPVEK